MATKLNSEFNYRYQIQGETIWEKLKYLQNFLVGRKRAAVLEEVQLLKTKAKISKLNYLKNNSGPEHEILELEAEMLEAKSFETDQQECFELNKQEIEILERLITEAKEIAEPTRISGYTDEQMFEANAVNEFTVWLAKEMQADLISSGRPTAAHVRNAMSNQVTWDALKAIGFIPNDNFIIEGNNNPLKVELTLPPKLALPSK